MARMIPSVADEQTPPGEHAVYYILAAGPEDWLILHSLDLVIWNRGLRNDVDFVVIIPDTGIVCVEVKSRMNITFDGQRWNPLDIRRSAFKQAADGRFTFYRCMRELSPRRGCVPVVHSCIFTQETFDLALNLSVTPWELINTRSFRALNTSELFCANIKTRLSKSIEADGKLHHLSHLSTPLSSSNLNRLIEVYVPVRKRRPGAREEIQRREEQAASILREQQKPVLQLSELNMHIIVSGGAGTGKTMVVMEVAKRMAETG